MTFLHKTVILGFVGLAGGSALLYVKTDRPVMQLQALVTGTTPLLHPCL